MEEEQRVPTPLTDVFTIAVAPPGQTVVMAKKETGDDMTDPRVGIVLPKDRQPTGAIFIRRVDQPEAEIINFMTEGDA
ncbi:MAG: hypothetical protein LC802_18370 [Acidobacteria bacterium]|nr:hypothetical protein [Acidobacteriota bacterium]